MLVDTSRSNLIQCMVAHANYGLFFANSNGKNFVGTSQVHDALTKKLIECFLVDSKDHFSSLRRMAAMCYELRFGRMSGLQRISSLSCDPASTSSSRALRNNQSGPFPTLFLTRRCVVFSWCSELTLKGWTLLFRLSPNVTSLLVGWSAENLFCDLSCSDSYHPFRKIMLSQGPSCDVRSGKTC